MSVFSYILNKHLTKEVVVMPVYSEHDGMYLGEAKTDAEVHQMKQEDNERWAEIAREISK